MDTTKNIVAAAEEYVFRYLKEHLSGKYIYHNYNHASEVAACAAEIAEGSGLNDEEKEIVLLASWFHDTGYTEINKGHEEVSKRIAEEFLRSKKYSEAKIEKVSNCILATQVSQTPANKLEEVICDADLANLGQENHADKSRLLVTEWEIAHNKKFEEAEQMELEIDFLTDHKYHTRYAQEKFNETKSNNIAQLRQDLKRIKAKEHAQSIRENQRESRTDRGIQTLFRVAFRNHINLSDIADNKANIMLSINAIIISITISWLVSNFNTDPRLVIPTTTLLVVCLLTIIFATLATRPKVTRGRVTRDDIEKKKGNLLFFGNFHNMAQEEYLSGMQYMLNDKEYLYDSLVNDLYSLGVVLNRKYKYLRICFHIFMYGMIAAVSLFGLMFI